MLIAHYLFPKAAYAGVVAGAASIVGHIFPFYLRFRGGKGYASYLGVMLALDWKYTLISFAVTVIVTLITNYMIIGNASTVLPFPVYLAVRGDFVRAIIMLLVTALVIYKHRSHFAALFHRQEPRFFDSLRKKHSEEIK